MRDDKHPLGIALWSDIDQAVSTALPFALYLTGVIFTGGVTCFAPAVVHGRKHINGVVLTVSLVRPQCARYLS